MQESDLKVGVHIESLVTGSVFTLTSPGNTLQKGWYTKDQLGAVIFIPTDRIIKYFALVPSTVQVSKVQAETKGPKVGEQYVVRGFLDTFQDQPIAQWMKDIWRDKQICTVTKVVGNKYYLTPGGEHAVEGEAQFEREDFERYFKPIRKTSNFDDAYKIPSAEQLFFSKPLPGHCICGILRTSGKCTYH